MQVNDFSIYSFMHFVYLYILFEFFHFILFMHVYLLSFTLHNDFINEIKTQSLKPPVIVSTIKFMSNW
ncbi:Uncharacterized protein TCM_039319 [Theobroma cacao]|uniref:Uncharacterized protein n=1 Tax=Theobroma cacao TaxID=3641 RepID=A0A061GRZ9_THECC|nr:Uncharacterized protein TCM_039319 [Theobroma cacao]